MQRAEESPTPVELGGSAGDRAGETPVNDAMGVDGFRRLYRYATAKAHTLRVVDAIGITAAHRAGMRPSAMQRCGDWLVFRHFPTLANTKLHSANFCCVHLACGFCAIRRGARMMARYLERFQSILRRHPDLKPYLVTFTVKNGTDLRERLEHLERSLTRLHKRRHGKRSRSLLVGVEGAVWSYEVTHSEKNGWHPHVHAIWLAKEQPDMYALRDEWSEITVDSFMCDVRAIEPKQRSDSDGGEGSIADPYAKGFAEVFKYALKAAELPPDRLFEAFKVLKGRRLIRSFGHFFGVKEPTDGDLADDMPADDWLPYVDLIWRFNRGRERYELHEKRAGESGCQGRGDAAGVPSGPETRAATVAACDLHRSTRRTEQRGRDVRRRVADILAEGAGFGPRAIL